MPYPQKGNPLTANVERHAALSAVALALAALSPGCTAEGSNSTSTERDGSAPQADSASGGAPTGYGGQGSGASGSGGGVSSGGSGSGGTASSGNGGQSAAPGTGGSSTGTGGTLGDAGAFSHSPGPACTEAVAHTNAISKSTPNKPGYLQSYVDPYFGSTVTRITGDPGTPIENIGGSWPDVCRNNYMKDQAWNADMTLIRLQWGCHMYLDAKTLRPVFNANAPGESRWHPTDPNVRIYLSGNRVGRFDPRTGNNEVIETFDGYSGLGFELEGNLSHDGEWIAPHGTDPNGNSVAFAFHIPTKTKYPDIPTPAPLDWVTISPSGDYVVVNANWCNDSTGGTSTDRLNIFDSRTGEQIGNVNCGYGLPSHQDLTFDNNGDDVIAGIAKSGPYAWNNTIMRRLSDGEIRDIGPGGSHTGARATRRIGWVFLQPYTDPYDGEIVGIEATWSGTPRVERYAYIPNDDGSYDSQNYGTVSPDGKQFLVGSNWGDASGPVQSYLIDMSALCP